MSSLISTYFLGWSDERVRYVECGSFGGSPLPLRVKYPRLLDTPQIAQDRICHFCFAIAQKNPKQKPKKETIPEVLLAQLRVKRTAVILLWLLW